MKKYTNIFTFLMAVIVFALVLRLIDISDISSQFLNDNASVNIAKENVTASESKINLIDTVKNINPTRLGNVAFASGGEPSSEGLQKVTSVSKPKYGETIFTDSEIEVLKSLSQRRQELDERSREVERRETLLKAAEQEVDKKITDLIKLKREIEALLDKQGGMQEDRIASLVKIYEGMKPAQAASIFNSLDMEILLPVIGNMNERRSSPILALMDANKAREVTLKLAGEFKLPETPAQIGK